MKVAQYFVFPGNCSCPGFINLSDNQMYPSTLALEHEWKFYLPFLAGGKVQQKVVLIFFYNHFDVLARHSSFF